MKMISILAFVLFAVSAHAAEKSAAIQADNNAINQACSAEAQTAGCGGEVVGKGLLKCLHAYKKAHHDFKFSEGCKSAMKARHAEEKAEKGAATPTAQAPAAGK